MKLERLNEGLGKEYKLEDKSLSHLGANLICMDWILGRIDPDVENTYEVLEKE